jgi:uncharacterized protein (TIGR00251 family)
MREEELKQQLLPGKMIILKVKTQMPVTRIIPEKSTIERDSIFLIMDVHAAPENNKANIEIIKFFYKHFKIKIRIIKGFSSREKVIEIVN